MAVSSVFQFVPRNRRGEVLRSSNDGATSFWPRTRIRRPLDVARLMFAAVSLAVLIALASWKGGLLRTVTSWIPTTSAGLPKGVLSIANVSVSVAVLGVLIAIGVDAVRFHPFSLSRALLAFALAGLGGWGLGSIVGLVAGHEVATSLIGSPGDSAGRPITAVIALVVGADLHRRRWWRAVRVAVTVAVGCALVLGTLTIPSATYALLVGATAGFAVRVAAGVVPARPTLDAIRSELVEAGFALVDLQPLEQVAGRSTYVGISPDVGPVRVTVVDPDRGGVPFVRRSWRLLRLRTAVVGKPALTLRGQLERQALTSSLARSAGVDAPQVLALVGAGPALVLLERTLIGTPLSQAAEGDAAAGALSAFVALHRLHSVGLAHGALTADGIVLLPGGGAGFGDFSVAQPAAVELQRGLDILSLLVAVATRVGADAAVKALRAAATMTSMSEAQLAALLQPVILPRQLRLEIRRTPLLAELRTAITGPGARSGIPAVPRLERLRPRTVISVVGASIAAYLLATQLSQVSIGSALRSANPGWLAVAVLGSAVTYLGSALTLQAFVSTKLRLARTTLVQLATAFVALVTPPAVGHVGLDIRYLQKAGVPTSVAAAEVAVREVVTVVITIPLLLLCGWLSGASGSRLALLPSGGVLIVLGVTAVVLALVAAAPPTRRLLHRRLEPLIRQIVPQLIATVSDPRRLAIAFTGVLLLNGGYVLALDASLRAFSASLDLPTLVVVYLAASTLGSAAPTPGGLGAVEAALVGGLSATGVPVAAAITAVLAFRAATFWLPAPLGWIAFVGLQRRDRL